jgi:hypothetical protein
MSMDNQVFINKVERYTKEAIKDFKKIKESSGLESQLTEVQNCLRKHSEKFKELMKNKPQGHLGYYLYSDPDIYQREIKKIKELEGKLLQK